MPVENIKLFDNEFATISQLLNVVETLENEIMTQRDEMNYVRDYSQITDASELVSIANVSLDRSRKVLEEVGLIG